MKSLEALFVEALDGMDAKQKERFFVERDALGKDGKFPSLEVQLNLARAVTERKIVESLRESTPIKRNNGAVVVEESQMTEIQARQAKAWQKMGFSEVEAKIVAGCYDGELKKALVQGKTAKEFFESIREAAAPEKNLGDRQQRAMNLLNRK